MLSKPSMRGRDGPPALTWSAVTRAAGMEKSCASSTLNSNKRSVTPTRIKLVLRKRFVSSTVEFLRGARYQYCRLSYPRSRRRAPPACDAAY